MPPRNVYKAKKGTLKTRAEGLGNDIGFRFDQWGIELDKLFMALGNNPQLFAKLFEDLIGQLFQNIVIATPVDTGQARASWRLNKTKNTATEVEWRIVNGVPYIVFLELGSSKQAANGMVRVNLDKFIKDTRTLAKRLAKSGRFLK